MSQKLKLSVSEEKVLLNKGYKLLLQVGEGGYAKVYLGVFKPMNSDKPIQLACKIINSQKAQKKYVTKFLPRELKILVKVNHPHIVQIHSIYQRKAKFYIFMRYAEKGDLLDFILRNGAIDESQARIWARQLALAIQYLHILEIAHRDLKCENILITVHNNVKLSDFGFARSVLNNERQRELSETFCGSVSYAPPEILNGDPYNPKIADMWSLGILIYTMLNKAVPFPDTKNTKNMYNSQMQKKWKFRNKFADMLSEQVKSLITELLEPDVLLRVKIEDVINSSWIAMDAKLKSLNTYEFTALKTAMDDAKSNNVQNDPYEGPRNRAFSSAIKKININKNSLNIFKEYDKGFDLHLLRSEFNRFE